MTFINEDSDNDDASLAAKSVESDVSLQSISSEELLETLRLRYVLQNAFRSSCN